MEEDSAILSVCLVLSMVVYLNSIRERHKLTRSAVLRPKFAPWMQLLNFGDETSFLDLTGFSRAAFMQLETACFTEQDGIRTVNRLYIVVITQSRFL